MSVVHGDTVHIENSVNLLCDVSAAGFDTVAFFERIGVVCANPSEVTNLIVLLKSRKVDSLNKQVRLSAPGLHKRTLFNALDVPNQHLLHA